MHNNYVINKAVIIQKTHKLALEAAKKFKRAEAELLDVIIKIDEHRVFVAMGYSSLFTYCVSALGLTEGVAYNFVNVARKSKEVPELKNSIVKGMLSVTKARKITSVITKSNQETWLKKATTLSSRRLEQEVAKVNPKEAVKERASYVSEKRLALTLGVSEKLMLDLRRAQDIESQTQGKPASLEEALEKVLSIYLEAKDPVRRAKRAVAKKGIKPSDVHTLKNELFTGTVNQTECSTINSQEDKNGREISSDVSLKIDHIKNPATLICPSLPTCSVRTLVPSASKHQVNLRDEGRCTHAHKNGRRCNQKRWLEIHHITPVKNGGLNSPENLTTLCFNHHSFFTLQVSL